MRQVRKLTRFRKGMRRKMSRTLKSQELLMYLPVCLSVYLSIYLSIYYLCIYSLLRYISLIFPSLHSSQPLPPHSFFPLPYIYSFSVSLQKKASLAGMSTKRGIVSYSKSRYKLLYQNGMSPPNRNKRIPNTGKRGMGSFTLPSQTTQL